MNENPITKQVLKDILQRDIDNLNLTIELIKGSDIEEVLKLQIVTKYYQSIGHIFESIQLLKK